MYKTYTSGCCEVDFGQGISDFDPQAVPFFECECLAGKSIVAQMRYQIGLVVCFEGLFEQVACI
jgi:hypothetical protein